MPSQSLQNMLRDMPAAVLAEVAAVEKDRDKQLDDAAQTLVDLRRQLAEARRELHEERAKGRQQA